jgi:LmbE family N-acetylglucosaminyl deacetylase
MQETPQRVLVVIPHPDDGEFWCGGTVARWVREGASVHYLLCTDGGKGTSDREVTSQEMAATRMREQQTAAEILGVKDTEMLGHPDGELEDCREFRKEIVRKIRRVRPDVVLCPEPYRKNLTWHRDHRIAGQVALDAVFPYARDHLHLTELWEQEGLEPHKTGTVLFWGAEQPDTHIDIGDTLAAKVQAVMAHQSQLWAKTEADIEEFVREWAAAAGEGQDYPYAEAFRKVTFRT